MDAWFDELVQEACQLAASDLHLVTGNRPMVRLSTGELSPLGEAVVTSEAMAALVPKLLPSPELGERNLRGKFYADGDIDISLTFFHEDKAIPARVNIFQEKRGTGVAIRFLSDDIPTMQRISLPTVVQDLAKKAFGLVLFTAPTGNGKSTSIASILEQVNQTQAKRIITIEDPVEYRLKSKRSLVSQREVGTNCVSFEQGLKAALREDPDIIMVGEMRDRETILTALAAAETGHLVFSTLHSANVIQAVDRLLQYFRAQEQESILAQFANAFEAVIAQKLLPRKDGVGRVAAFEVLLRTQATTNVIRTGKAFSLAGYMSHNEGMQTMGEAIETLRSLGAIA